MYCSQCGAKLPDTAQFCSQCGAPTALHAADGTGENKTMITAVGSRGDSRAGDNNLAEGDACNAEDDSATSPLIGMPSDSKKSDAGSLEDGSQQSFVQRMVAFRRTTLKAVPTFVLAIVAFFAAAGTAYAAFKVVTEVVIPVVEQLVDQFQGDLSRHDSDESDGEAGSNVVSAQGRPRNILQLGEIISMDAEDIPAFLEEQGLVYMEETKEWVYGDDSDLTFGSLKDAGLFCGKVGDEEYENCVQLHNDAVEAARFTDEGVLLNIGTGELVATYVPGINLGHDLLWLSHFSGGSQIEKSDLDDGVSIPDSIRVYGIPLPYVVESVEDGVRTWEAPLTDGDVEKLCGEIMGLGKPLVIYRPATALISQGYGDASGLAFVDKTEVYASGMIEVRGEQCLWYFKYSGGTGNADGEAGILSLEAAKGILEHSDLYSEEEWDAANDFSRAGMFIQSRVADSRFGNGETIQLNYRTGIYQSMRVDNGAFHYIELDQAELARFGFDSYEEMEAMQPKPMEGTVIDFAASGDDNNQGA